MRSAAIGCAIEVALRVEDHSIGGSFIRGAVEGMQHGEGAARGGYFIDCAGIVSATLGSGAVDIPLLIEDEIAFRFGAVGLALEGVDLIVGPAATARHQLENHPGAVAPGVGRTVDVSGLVEEGVAEGAAAAVVIGELEDKVERIAAIGTDQLVDVGWSGAVDVAGLIEGEVAKLRPHSIIAAGKVIENGLRPGAERGLARGGRRLQVEDRAATLTEGAITAASIYGRAVEAAVRSKDHAAGRGLSVISSGKGVQEVEDPSGAFPGQLEGGAAADAAAKGAASAAVIAGHSVQIAALVHHQAAGRISSISLTGEVIEHLVGLGVRRLGGNRNPKRDCNRQCCSCWP